MIKVKYKHTYLVERLKPATGQCATEGCYHEPMATSRYCRNCRRKVRQKMKEESLREMARFAAAYDLDLPFDTNLYAIVAGPIVKFGKSRNPRDRMRDLQVSNGVPLVLAATLPCHHKLETLVHRFLIADCVRGEWHRHSMSTKIITNHMLAKNLEGLVRLVTGRKP